MLKIRTILLSVVFTLFLASVAYFTAMADSVTSAPGMSSNACVTGATSLSEQTLREVLNGRYERRVGLPR